MPINATAILVTQLIAAMYMCGVIVFVQVVHYPLFSRVDEANFHQYSIEHQRRTTWVVGPPMLIEFAMAALLFTTDLKLALQPVLLIASFLLVVIWLSTVALQMPIHAKLLESKSISAIARLVQTNWIRTIAWPMRAVLIGSYLFSNSPHN